MTKEPKTVPVLAANDMVKRVFFCGEKACLSGWLMRTFGGDCIGVNAVAYYAAMDALEGVCRGMSGRNSTIIGHNDKIFTLAQSARAWNKAMRSIGYTEVTDE